jgi:hypothetical protein
MRVGVSQTSFSSTPSINALIILGGSPTWCECIGEVKPFSIPSLANNARRQVLIAGSASIYHQISLGEQHPAVLLFTMVGKDVEFFQLTAMSVPSHSRPRWRLFWTKVVDYSLDYTRPEDCFTMVAFA